MEAARAVIEEAVLTGPFSTHGVADYSITAFHPTMTGKALEDLRGG